MLERFKILRGDVLKIGKCVLSDPDVPDRLKKSSGLSDDVQALDNGVFTIAVVAPFSTGKSTFVNALMGTDLLSMAVTAETAVVTRVRWGNQPRFRVECENGTSYEIPRRGQRIDLEGMKAHLKAITTVKHDFASDDAGAKVSRVTVEWDLDLLKDGVEIIDTPGLFSRHSTHNSITRDILPDAHAVIFLLEPNKLGEAHFTDEIRHYVLEAKHSNLDNRSRHIFFIINKLDECYDKYDMLVSELRASLDGILSQPQVLGMSSYYALSYRKFQRRELTLRDLQRDNRLHIPDPESPEDYLSGRLLEERHVSLLAEQSGISNVEKSLSNYLENRYLYMVDNVVDGVVALCTRALEEMDMQEHALREAASRTKDKYLSEVESVGHGIRDLEARTKDRTERIILQGLRGNHPGSVNERVKRLIDARKATIDHGLKDAFRIAWEQRRSRIDEKNAKAMIAEVTVDGERTAQTMLKEMIKDVHGEIADGVNRVMKEVRGLLESSQVDYEGLLSQLGLESSSSIVDFDAMTNRIQSEIESQFKQSIKSVASDVQGSVDSASSAATIRVIRPGLWNWIKSWFGLESYDEHFNRGKFAAILDSHVEEFATKYVEFLWEAVVGNQSTVEDGVNSVAASAMNEVERLIDFELTNRRALLADLEKQLKSEQRKADDIAKDHGSKRRRLREMLDEARVVEGACTTIREEN